MSNIHEALDKLTQNQDLPAELASSVIQDLLAGELTPAQIGGLLFGLRVKGESAEEIAAFANTLRQAGQRIQAPEGAVDTCGTGGDRAGTFNISTTAAFLVAGAGVPVAKHGGRFASGQCGSADVLECLGIPLSANPELSEHVLKETGITFLFAQLYHPAMAKVAAQRRELGIRTIFNLLGPLLNPANAPYQLLGVSALPILPKMAKALQLLGIRRAVVMVGEDGLDEVSLSAPTQAILVDGQDLTEFVITPEEFGFKRCSLHEIQGGTPEENAQITLKILQGEKGPKRDIVLLNAGTALFATHKVKSISGGIALATESLDSGRALEKLEQLRQSLHPELTAYN
ncbi:anthranilate phosphoribosyltransferase [Desulfitobacterium sp.]|uniref:anthranilate phosphoribosyltransferase n=1 Tax=Desulfitobacterium sp. TaxID=49981 RepID=UPI002BCACF4E|nr:anthranilate phosphoribosyltransferase [Desulfitobacterium sp.]HVJ50315.1 anthranilate phosphoribosyltransferase [Desulfitobacterium sp.]